MGFEHVAKEAVLNFPFDIIMPLDYCISSVMWPEVPIFICMQCFCHMVQLTLMFLFGWI